MAEVDNQAPEVEQGEAAISSDGTSVSPAIQTNRPVRPGITWREGAKIEARDFMNKW
jgi:hypothetical protein